MIDSTSSMILISVSLIPDCSSTDVEEIKGSLKGLIKITDALGRSVKATNNNPLFYIFDDGTVEKRVTIE